MPIFDFVCDNDHHFERFCKKSTFVPKCPVCGEEGEKIFSPSSKKSGEAGREYPFVTKDLTGEPIEIRSAGHEREVLSQIERETGEKIRKRDDAAFLTKEHAGTDWRTGEPLYSESSGAGLPGSWSGLPSGHPEMRRLQNERYADEEE